MFSCPGPELLLPRVPHQAQDLYASCVYGSATLGGPLEVTPSPRSGGPPQPIPANASLSRGSTQTDLGSVVNHFSWSGPWVVQAAERPGVRSSAVFGSCSSRVRDLVLPCRVVTRCRAAVASLSHCENPGFPALEPVRRTGTWQTGHNPLEILGPDGRIRMPSETLR